MNKIQQIPQREISQQWTFDILEKNHMHGFSNFVADRMDKHNKHQWMLKSTIKK
jgi:DNA-binding ferritin-like protein